MRARFLGQNILYLLLAILADGIIYCTHYDRIGLCRLSVCAVVLYYVSKLYMIHTSKLQKCPSEQVNI